MDEFYKFSLRFIVCGAVLGAAWGWFTYKEEEL